MRKFIITLLRFLFPILGLLFFVEIFILYFPNTFNKKANFLDQNLDIQVLFFGSSHTHNAINPEYINLKTSNLANSGQDYQLDYAIFFKNIKKLKKLKYLFMEVDYHSLENKNYDDYHLIPMYYRFYGILGNRVSLSNKILIYSSSPDYYNNFIKFNLNPYEYKFKINKFGAILNDTPGEFYDLKYDSIKIINTYEKRLKGKHANLSYANYVFNKEKLNKIISYCNNNSIKVFILKTPAYYSYQKNYIIQKNKRRELYLDSLLNEGITILDYEKDIRFNARDYKNDDHLNSEGSKKMTLIINDILKKYEHY